MKTALLFALVVSFLLLPLRAEDWTTADGKVYQNVRVISQTPAYVTIMHQDGGGQIQLSQLPADLQQRFNYTPAAAAKFLADTVAAAQLNKDALAKEKARLAAQEAAKQEANAEAFFIALFTLPPDRDVPSANSVASSSEDSVPPPDASAPPIASEPPTQIDDWGYGNYGTYGYGGYGYGYPSYRYGYGYRGYRGGWSGHHGTHTRVNSANVQVYPKH